MKVGDLVRNIFTNQVGIILKPHSGECRQYHTVAFTKEIWNIGMRSTDREGCIYLVPKEHLEVMSESR